MTALALHEDAPARRAHRVPWSPRAWSQAFYLTAGIPALLAVPLLLLVPEIAAGVRPRWPLPLLLAVVALLAAPLLTGSTGTGSAPRPGSRYSRNRSCRTG